MMKEHLNFLKFKFVANMSEEVPETCIKNVQNSLSKYVKRPPLSEKLLRKPPFRYLHDIVNVVIKETNFLHNVYTAEELDSNNVKDKESKIMFLEKLIAAVKTASGKKITARPSKIVAGLDVIKTLELLQALGEAIEANNASVQDISNVTQNTELQTVKETKVIEKIKEFNIKDRPNNIIEKNVEPKIRNKESTKLLSKIHGTSVSNANNKRSISVTKIREDLEKECIEASLPNKVKVIKISKDMNNSVEKCESTKKNISANKQMQNKLMPTRKLSLKENNRSNIDNSIRSSSLSREQNGLRSKKEPQKSEKVEKINDENKLTELVENGASVDVQNEADRTKHISKEDLNETKLSEIHANENEMLKDQNRDALVESTKRNESAISKRPNSARPGTRRPLHNDGEKAVADERADNVNPEKNNVELRNQNYIRPRTTIRPPSTRPGAPRIKDRGEIQVSEENVTITKPVNVIEEGKQDQIGDDKESCIIVESDQTPTSLAEPIEVNEAKQGQLVHQILKTEKELNESMTGDVQNMHLEIEWEAGKQCGRDIILKEIEMMRSSIQNLTSAANPLGKLFDFLQEDVDEMHRELQHWKGLNKTLQERKQVELELRKLLLKPLLKQLSDVENNIQDKLVQIANVKVSILTNDERISKLVSGTGSINNNEFTSPKKSQKQNEE